MRKLVTVLTLISFIMTKATALAGPHEEGIAAGQGANPLIQGQINAPSASAIVPGYTNTPPESAYYAQPNLTGQANAQLAQCAPTLNDPVCEAQTGAVSSANTSRPAVSPNDPAVANASSIARTPSSVLGDLSSAYAGCPTSSPSTCAANVFCLGTSCFNTNYTNDADFARTMSLMEAAREAGVYLDTANMQVFKGEPNNCRNGLLNNCCYSNSAGAGMSNRSVFGVGSRLVYDILMNSENREFLYQGISALLSSGGFSGSFTTYGVTIAVNGTALPAGSVVLTSTDNLVIAFDPWTLAIAVIAYTAMSMMSCSQEEGLLALKEGGSLCHTVGTYCSSCIRIFGSCVACIEHTTGKCCFNSRLSRMVNEQGRVQVGKGWGSAQSPDCSGFTIAQLQSLDFAVMDLTEFYASIVPTLPNVSAIQTNNAQRASNCYFGQGRCQ